MPAILCLLLGLAAEGRTQSDLISFGAYWRFLDDGSDQGTAWRDPEFDDSGWPLLPAELGYGDGDEFTIVDYGPDPNDKHITTYFRHSFDVASPATFEGLRLRLKRDDGAVVYLNGSEVWRSNMPEGPITSETTAFLANDDGDGVHERIVSPGHLIAGTNVLSVEIHQRSPTSSDISFDLALEGLSTLELADETLIEFESGWRYLDDGSDQGTAWRAAAFDDASWAQGQAELGYGEGDEATEVSFGPDSSDKYITTYFRKEFDVFAADRFESIRLLLRRDDGASVYLNGVELMRSNLPSGPITSETPAFPAFDDGELIFEEVVGPGALVEGRNVVAVEVHQTSPDSSDISFDLRAEAFATRPPGTAIERGPYLQLASETAMTIRWRTSVFRVGEVRYGSAPDTLDQTAGGTGEPATEHEVRIEGLALGSRYYYAVADETGVQAGGTADYFFNTHPPAGSRDPVRVWVIGDSGTGDSRAMAVRDAYLDFVASAPAQVWVMLGDNAYSSGTDLEYQTKFFEIYDGIMRNTPVWPALGNHDAISADSPTQTGVYYDIFTLPTAAEAGGTESGTEAYYSFDYANVRFLCLDSHDTDRSTDGAMLTWLGNDLEQAALAGQDWAIAFWHHPPYSKGSHNSDSLSDSGGRMVDMRERALPILEEGGADLVLAGHSHSYERSVLLSGHYDFSATFVPATHAVDAGDGDPAGAGAYQKPPGLAPHAGTVYAVAGSSGQTSGGSLDHPAMTVSLNVLGSMILDIEGDRLEAVFLDDEGTIRDRFVIEKSPDVPGQVIFAY